MLYRTFYKDFEKGEWESAKQVGGVRVEMKPKIESSRIATRREQSHESSHDGFSTVNASPAHDAKRVITNWLETDLPKAAPKIADRIAACH